MLAAGKALGAGGLVGGGSSIAYVGSVGVALSTAPGQMDTEAEADTLFDIASVASAGDLVIISTGSLGNITLAGPTFTEISDVFVSSFIHYQTFYRFWQAGDGNPYLSSSGSFPTLNATIFSGVNSYLGIATANSLDAPSLTQNGELWVTVGNQLMDNPASSTTATPPSGYTLAASAGDASASLHIAAAYKIASLSSDNPGAWSLGTPAGFAPVYHSKTIAFD